MNKKTPENTPIKSFSIKDIIMEGKSTDKKYEDTTENKSYYELLKDPRWQKMRLKVMERDGFRCDHCDSVDNSLNVHHLIYIKNAKPWEYDPDDLLTLCEGCHRNLTNAINEIMLIIKRSARSRSCYSWINIIKNIYKNIYSE
jgi:hypothetical protein